MLDKIPKQYMERIVNNNKGLSLTGMFSSFQACYGNIRQVPEVKEMFLALLSDLMKKGELKLATKGKFLEGTIDEQINLFRQAWPDHYDENVMEYDIDNLWWYSCAPAGAVWIDKDGWEEWT
jgi:hypothetical protein